MTHKLDPDKRAELEKKGITSIEYLDKGHRGIVYQGKLNGKDIIIKVKKHDSGAICRMENEARWLKRLGKTEVGPKFLFNGEDYLVYEMVKGELILDFVVKADKEGIISVMKRLLRKMLLLDLIGVNKEEMHHPVKHVFVDKGEPRMIDFERCRNTLTPKNVTQTCQFLAGTRMSALLGKKGIRIDREKLMADARAYKEALNAYILSRDDKKKKIAEKRFEKIISTLRTSAS